VPHVCRDDHSPPRHFVPHERRIEPLSLRYDPHFLRDGAPPGVTHLGADRAVATAGDPRRPPRLIGRHGVQIAVPGPLVP
jgi:hypothetical protein